MQELIHALLHLTREIREEREQRKHENAILCRLAEMERNIMAAFDDVKLELGAINGTTTEIATDIDELIKLIATPGGMSEAQAQEVLADLKGISTTLKGVAAKYPVPPSEPA